MVGSISPLSLLLNFSDDDDDPVVVNHVFSLPFWVTGTYLSCNKCYHLTVRCSSEMQQNCSCGGTGTGGTSGGGGWGTGYHAQHPWPLPLPPPPPPVHGGGGGVLYPTPPTVPCPTANPLDTAAADMNARILDKIFAVLGQHQSKLVGNYQGKGEDLEGESLQSPAAENLTRMERNEIILTVVLSTVAALVSMGLTFLLCHWCSRRKHKRRTDELESLQSILSPDNNAPEKGKDFPRGNSFDEKNGKSSLKLKAPMIKTKGVNAQLEHENQANSHQEIVNGQTKSGSGTGRDPEHSKVQFWQNRSLSQVDMFIDQSETSDNCGQLQFSLEYDFQASTLIIKIIQAKELPALDLSGTSDPYVRVTLLPDKKHRLETKIKRRTLHPRWNETFYFEGFPIQKLQSRVLHLHVFDYDRFSRDDSIGEVYMPLCQVDLSEKPIFWKALKAPLKDKCGELLVSLCYHPTTSQLTIVIVKARNLKAKDITGKSDPYVKVWLQYGDKRVEKKKTCIIKRTLNPVYNESFVFTVPWEKLRETSLLVQVMDFDSVGRNELIGKIVMSAKGGVTESKHWNEMISKPRQPVLQWHRLKPE